MRTRPRAPSVRAGRCACVPNLRGGAAAVICIALPTGDLLLLPACLSRRAQDCARQRPTRRYHQGRLAAQAPLQPARCGGAAGGPRVRCGGDVIAAASCRAPAYAAKCCWRARCASIASLIPSFPTPCAPCCLQSRVTPPPGPGSSRSLMPSRRRRGEQGRCTPVAAAAEGMQLQRRVSERPGCRRSNHAHPARPCLGHAGPAELVWWW